MKTFLYSSLALIIALVLSSGSTAQTFTAKGKPVETKRTSAACGCCAQGGLAQTSPILMALDTDKDGQLSAAEIKNAAQALSALDADGSGQLSHDEMHAKPKVSKVNTRSKHNLTLGMSMDEYVQKSLDSYDKNGNGKLDKSEMTERMKAMLEFVDSDGDEVLTKAELMNMNNQAKINRAKKIERLELEKSKKTKKPRRDKR